MGITLGKAAIRLEAEKPCYISIIGGPGSGKTTQSRYIHELFDFAHLSPGQILRQSITNQRIPNGESIQKIMKQMEMMYADLIQKI